MTYSMMDWRDQEITCDNIDQFQNLVSYFIGQGWQKSTMSTCNLQTFKLYKQLHYFSSKGCEESNVASIKLILNPYE